MVKRRAVEAGVDMPHAVKRSNNGTSSQRSSLANPDDPVTYYVTYTQNKRFPDESGELFAQMEGYKDIASANKKASEGAKGDACYGLELEKRYDPDWKDGAETVEDGQGFQCYARDGRARYLFYDRINGSREIAVIQERGIPELSTLPPARSVDKRSVEAAGTVSVEAKDRRTQTHKAKRNADMPLPAPPPLRIDPPHLQYVMSQIPRSTGDLEHDQEALRKFCPPIDLEQLSRCRTGICEHHSPMVLAWSHLLPKLIDTGLTATAEKAALQQKIDSLEEENAELRAELEEIQCGTLPAEERLKEAALFEKYKKYYVIGDAQLITRGVDMESRWAERRAMWGLDSEEPTASGTTGYNLAASEVMNVAAEKKDNQKGLSQRSKMDQVPSRRLKPWEISHVDVDGNPVPWAKTSTVSGYDLRQPNLGVQIPTWPTYDLPSPKTHLHNSEATPKTLPPPKSRTSRKTVYSVIYRYDEHYGKGDFALYGVYKDLARANEVAADVVRDMLANCDPNDVDEQGKSNDPWAGPTGDIGELQRRWGSNGEVRYAMDEETEGNGYVAVLRHKLNQAPKWRHMKQEQTFGLTLGQMREP